MSGVSNIVSLRLLASLTNWSAELIKSGTEKASVVRPSYRPSVRQQFLEIYLLLQFLSNLFQTLHMCGPDIGAKIVRCRILNFCLNQILGSVQKKIAIFFNILAYILLDNDYFFSILGIDILVCPPSNIMKTDLVPKKLGLFFQKY